MFLTFWVLYSYIVLGVEKMFKGIVFILVLVLLSCAVYADSLVLRPVESLLNNSKNTADLGRIMPGQTLKLIISDNSFKGFLWKKAEVISLPAGWELLNSFKNDKAFEVHILVPETTQLNVYSFKVKVSAPSVSVLTEQYEFRVQVADGLIFSSSPKLSLEGLIGSKTDFELTVYNNSMSDETVLIQSTLPETWTKPKEILLKANSAETLKFELIPQRIGLRSFSFAVGNDSKSFSSIDAEIKVQPSLHAKYFAFIAGFPFYSVSVVPFSLLNALAAHFHFF